jgi:hypothetical protein
MDHVLTWTEEHGPDEMARYREIWAAIDAVRGELVALRSDIMLAKGAVRASTVIAGIIVVVIGAGWTLIQTVAAHIPLK